MKQLHSSFLLVICCAFILATASPTLNLDKTTHHDISKARKGRLQSPIPSIDAENTVFPIIPFDEGDKPCVPNECHDLAEACHQQSIRACQVASRRRDSCLENFARRCHLLFLNCQARCQEYSGPDPYDENGAPVTVQIPLNGGV